MQMNESVISTNFANDLSINSTTFCAKIINKIIRNVAKDVKRALRHNKIAFLNQLVDTFSVEDLQIYVHEDYLTLGFTPVYGHDRAIKERGEHHERALGYQNYYNKYDEI